MVLDVPQLDAVAADLDLVVATADEEHEVGGLAAVFGAGPVAVIAGAVPAPVRGAIVLPRPVVDRDEPLPGQFLAPQVAVREAASAGGAVAPTLVDNAVGLAGKRVPVRDGGPIRGKIGRAVDDVLIRPDPRLCGPSHGHEAHTAIPVRARDRAEAFGQGE